MKLHLEENKYGEGIRKDETEHYVFDNGLDLDTDIIFLTTNTSGKKSVGGIDYYYGYEFNDNIDPKTQSDFRQTLKHSFNDPNVFYSDEADRFVRDGLYRMAEMKRFKDFDAVISTADHYGDETLTGEMCMIVWDEVSDNIPCYYVQLIKRLCSEVTFDTERAKEGLMRTEKYGNNELAAEKAVQSLQKQFEKARANGELFKMKHYKPVAGRIGFMDFLKFANAYDQKFYETLREGAEVLICEDFLTSGATVNEIIRFLNSINPDTRISVFVLINQLRTY